MRRVYWNAIQKKLLSEYEMQAALHGVDVSEGKGSGKFSQSEAEEYIKNPLKDFPNDVDYSAFKDEGLMFKQREYAAFMKQHNRPLTFEESKIYWSPERLHALKGNDPVSKRASVKGDLWALYLEMRKHKPDVTIEDLRQVVANDFAFARIFPSMSELAEYNKGRPRDKLYSLIGTVIEVPKEHLQKVFDARSFPKELMRYGINL